jgi:hypothetical protein
VTSLFHKVAEATLGVLFTAFALVLGHAALAAPAAEEPAPRPASPHLPELRAVPKVVSYRLDAKLDENAHRVDGTGVIEFVNSSRAPLHEIYVHLYLNAFKHEKSLFLRSPFGEGRGGARAEDWGFIDVTKLTARELEGADLWATRANGSPEEPDDETDVRLALPRPLAPGDRLTLDVAFSSKLPRVVLRTGYSGDFHLVGQWFPKIARLSPDGTFAHFPFHPQAEFFADFGDYDVTLDVAERMVVGATGERVESRVASGRRRDRYRAEAVHDFAWTAWSGFEDLAQRIDGVAVRVLYPKGHGRNARAALDAIAFALPRASRLYGAYPYPTLTVVHPPEQAAQAGGMEYPTLITTGGPWYAGLAGDRSIEAVTIHELLHQWFYGLVASDEARFPVLDEGLTSYAEQRLLDLGWGPGSLFRGFGLALSMGAASRTLAVERGEDVPLSQPASRFPGFRSLAALVYTRTATLLETFARVYGRERVERALGTYARRHRFGHPEPADFLQAMEEELGPAASAQLDRALHQRGRVNYLVRDLQSAPERTPGGVFDEATRAAPVAGSTVPERFRGRAVIYRHGTLELPVDIELIDTRGNVTRTRWSGEGPFHVVEHRGGAPLARVVVDPERRVLIDDNLLDNAASQDDDFPLRTLERSAYVGVLALALFGP